MSNKIKKVICHNCGFEQVMDDVSLSYYQTNSLGEYLCESDCEGTSVVSVTEEGITAEEIINYIEDNLENANRHSMVDFPGTLFNAIVKEFDFDEERSEKLARIINECFESLY
jgi:short subunit dehydrogenase-like uncharacterized protein